jgi:hypothetical protein
MPEVAGSTPARRTNSMVALAQQVRAPGCELGGCGFEPSTVQARTALQNFVEYVYKELQFALREAIGSRTLDELLGAKGDLDREIRRRRAARSSSTASGSRASATRT